MIRHTDGDILILHILRLWVRRRNEINLVHRVCGSCRQLGDTHIGELLHRIDQLLHLGLGVGLALQVIVHQIVNTRSNEVGNQRIHLSFGVISLKSGGNQRTDLCRGRVVGQCGGDGTCNSGIHLYGGRVGSECRVQRSSDGRVGLSLRVVVGEVDGRGAYLLPTVGSCTLVCGRDSDKLILRILLLGVCRRNEIDDIHRVG